MPCLASRIREWNGDDSVGAVADPLSTADRFELGGGGEHSENCADFVIQRRPFSYFRDVGGVLHVKRVWVAKERV